jgi:hypothetical protein
LTPQVETIERFTVQWLAVRLTPEEPRQGSSFQDMKQEFSDSIPLENKLNEDLQKLQRVCYSVQHSSVQLLPLHF